jgi:hypothetical protein
VRWDVVLLTYVSGPRLDEDDAPLGEALSRRGLLWKALPWDAPFRWGTTRLAVIRSTWDYARRRGVYKRRLAAIATRTRLVNPLEVVERNIHKGYLLDLAARGIPVVPTALLRKGEKRALDDLLAERGWDDAVVKPATSAGSWRTFRVRRGAPAIESRRARRLIGSRDALVQPFIPSVTGAGERAMMFFDGVFSHAIRKRSLFEPLSVEPRVACEPTPDELALAHEVLRVEGADSLAYARVDVTAGADGRPLLMELELIEPRLFFTSGPPEAPERFADAIVARLPA